MLLFGLWWNNIFNRLGWLLRLVGVEYDLQKKEAAYRKILVIAEDDENVGQKQLMNYFRCSINSFLSYIRYLYFNIGRMAYLQAMYYLHMYF